MSNSYPRESVEFLPITIAIDGVPVTTGVEVLIGINGSRPSEWVTPTTLNGKIGVMIDGLAPGLYNIWAKISSSPETPVIDCGIVSIT